MEIGQVIEWSRDALRMALILCGPPLAAALVVAVLVGAVQTVMQMHEPMVAQIPRQVLVMVVVVVCLPWMVSCWVEYARLLIGGLG
jgi:flagellar biosynthesis protein FliQ